MKLVSPYCLGLFLLGILSFHPIATGSSYTQITSTLSNEDADFMVKVSRSNLLETELGQIAQNKAANSEVKDYGEEMVHDFNKEDAALRSLAAARRFPIPDSISSWAVMEGNSLKFKEDGDFDQSYLVKTLTDQKHDVDAFEKEARDGNDPAIKAFASRRISEIRRHLHSVREIQIDMLTP